MNYTLRPRLNKHEITLANSHWGPKEDTDAMGALAGAFLSFAANTGIERRHVIYKRVPARTTVIYRENGGVRLEVSINGVVLCYYWFDTKEEFYEFDKECVIFCAIVKEMHVLKQGLKDLAYKLRGYGIVVHSIDSDKQNMRRPFLYQSRMFVEGKTLEELYGQFRK